MFCNCCKCTKAKLIKILPAGSASSNSLKDDVLRLTGISSPRELDDYVVLESHMYKEIFGEKKITAKGSHKRLSVVKICYDGQSIHRAYLSCSTEGFGKDFVALTPNSIYELSKNAAIPLGTEVTLSRGCRLLFYFYHPNAAVRMSFRIGILGIIATIVFSNEYEIWYMIKAMVNYLTNLFN